MEYLNIRTKRTFKSKVTMSIEHLQTEKPILSYEDWLQELKVITARETKTDIADVKINDAGAREWYEDGFTPYCTFRETFKALLL